MKHVLLIIFIVLTCFAGMLPTGNVNRTYVLDDSYPSANEDSSMDLYATYSMYSQSYTSGGGIEDNVVVRLQKIGSPTGTATARIYAASGSLPTGGVLAESDTLNVSTVSASLTSYTFKFSGAARVQVSGACCVVVRYAGGNSSNKLKIGTDTSASAHSGRLGYFDTSWHLDSATADMIFYSNVYR